MISAISRARRIFRGITRFSFFLAGSVEIPADLPLAEGEAPIGIYFNVPFSLDNAVVITSSSVILRVAAKWLSIPYKLISKVNIPTNPGHLGEVRQLMLSLSDGSSLALPVQGGAARTADAFEFARFLDRVRSDAFSG
jgi:hypothetical protein